MVPDGDGTAAAADQRLQLRALQDVRHHGPVPGHHLGAARRRRRAAVRRDVVQTAERLQIADRRLTQRCTSSWCCNVAESEAEMQRARGAGRGGGAPRQINNADWKTRRSSAPKSPRLPHRRAGHCGARQLAQLARGGHEPPPVRRRRSPADHGVLARPRPHRHLLLPQSRHRRDDQREFRR